MSCLFLLSSPIYRTFETVADFPCLICRGDIALISTPHPLTKPISGNRQPSSSPSVAPWCLQATWTHQHVGVVRALYYDERHKIVVTGGEDAKLQVWRDSTGGVLFEGDGDFDMDVDDAAPIEEEMKRNVRGGGAKNSRKRDLMSDGEDDEMVSDAH